MNKKAVGSSWERVAGEYIKKRGLQLLLFNYRCKIGEIDIIAKDGRYLVFIEVKYREDGRCGDSIESVSCWKQKRIRNTARKYMYDEGMDPDATYCRFDVIGCQGRLPDDYTVKWIKEAF